MSIKNINAREIAPIHTGEMLREYFMPDFNLTTDGLLTSNGQRTVERTPFCIPGHGFEVIQIVWEYAGVLAECTTGG